MRIATLSLAFMLIILSLFPVLEFSSHSENGTIVTGQSTEETNSTLVYPFDENFLDYTGYDDLEDQLFELEAANPEIMEIYDLTELTSFGTTHYGRTVWCVKISDGVGEEPDWYNDPDEEDIVIVGAHHAREWMTTMVSLYFIYYLLEFYGQMEVDNDGDGQIDEDPLDGHDNDGDGEDDDDDPSTIARMDGMDNDEDGLIDEGIDEDCIEGKATYLVNHREIWITPMLNPDGLEYDRTISEPGSGGGWRKNQRDQSQNGGKRSDGNGEFDAENDGVDLNRNYPYEWNRNEKGYVIDENGIIVTSDSRTESDAQYRGPDDDIDDDGDGFIGFDPVSGNPMYDPDGTDEDYWNGRDDDGDGLIDEDKDGGFTEPETQAMEELLKKLDIYDPEDTNDYPDGYRPENYDGVSNAVIGISYHSYSELVIWPWGYTHEDPEHEPLLDSIGRELMEITDYESWKDQGGYKVSGEWGDWMYGSHGVLSYTMELNSGSQGGFHPNVEYIIPTVRMNLGCNVFVSEIANKAEVARDHGGDDLSMQFPEFDYDGGSGECETDEEFGLRVTVLNHTNLDKTTVKAWYRVNGGEWKWTALSEDGNSQGVFEGRIQGQDEGTVVEYYFEGKDIRGVMIHSGYGEGTPYRFKVENDGFLSLAIADFLVILGVVAMCVWRRKHPSLMIYNNKNLP